MSEDCWLFIYKKFPGGGGAVSSLTIPTIGCSQLITVCLIMVQSYNSLGEKRLVTCICTYDDHTTPVVTSSQFRHLEPACVYNWLQYPKVMSLQIVPIGEPGFA